MLWQLQYYMKRVEGGIGEVVTLTCFDRRLRRVLAREQYSTSVIPCSYNTMYSTLQIVL